MINPSKEQLYRVSRHYQIALELLQASLDPSARPRRLSKDQAHLVLTHVPQAHDPSERAPFGVMPLGIIVKDQLVLTVCQHDSTVLHTVSAGYATHIAPATETSPQLLYRLLEAGAEAFLTAIQQVEGMVITVEQELQRSIKNRQVFKLLNHNKSLIAFANSLHSNASVLDGLRQRPIFEHDAEAMNALRNIQVATDQAEAKAATHSANLRNLMDAYSAAIENNLSLVVQYLSIYVIIMAVPMGIAGIYGMNTPLPLQDEPYILALLTVIGLTVAGLITRAFKARRII